MINGLVYLHEQDVIHRDIKGTHILTTKEIERLSGVNSDFAPFLQHAGVPSVDIYYGRDPFFWRHVAGNMTEDDWRWYMFDTVKVRPSFKRISFWIPCVQIQTPTESDCGRAH